MKKCCEHYNGTLDITNSCIFCKTFLGKDKEYIVDTYNISGVPDSSLKAMCKELDINEENLREYLRGQTCALVGNEPLIYSWDIKRFLNNLPVID